MSSASGPTDFPRPDLLPERLAEWISGEIVAGRFPPGERLVEHALSKRCNVSRVPLREALRIVAAQGLLILEPHRGAVVTPLSESELRELFDLRMAIEGFAAASAARQQPAAAFAALRRMNADLDELIQAEDYERYYALAAEFHDSLVAAAQNGLLVETYNRVKIRFRRYQAVLANIPHLPPRSVAEHTRILAAMEVGDADGARALIEAHIRDLVDAYGQSDAGRRFFDQAS